MASAFRRSKLHRHGIVLIGEYNKQELIEFKKKHPKRNVLYIGPNATVLQNSELPTPVNSWELRIHFKNKKVTLDNVKKMFKNITDGVSVEVTKDAMKTEPEKAPPAPLQKASQTAQTSDEEEDWSFEARKAEFAKKFKGRNG